MNLFLMSFVTVFIIILPDVAEAADDWIGITGYNHYSSCGNGAEAALNGTGTWACVLEETHELIIDLNQTYTIRKVRGRSNVQDDPVEIVITVSNSSASWGEGEALEESIWSDTDKMVEVDIDDVCGRYIKIEVASCERGPVLEFGGLELGFTIFDVYGEAYSVGTIDPNAPLTTGEWVPSVMADTWGLLSDDNDDTYIYADNWMIPLTESLQHQTCDPSSTGTITNVKLTARMKATHPADTVTIGIRVGAGWYGHGTTFHGTTFTPSWADYSYDWSKNPDTGRNWEQDDVIALASYLATVSGFGTVYCSEIYIDVEYIEAAYTFSDTTVDTGETITFNGSTSTGDVNWSWDFDNDGTADDYGETATYSYVKAGLYTVNLTTYDSNELNDSIDAQQITVKQKIDLVDNANNNGLNYVTWGANASTSASALTSYLNLGVDDLICKFNSSSGDWTSISYDCEHGLGVDFTINRWDHIRFQVEGASSFSFTPDSGTETTQSVTMKFNSSDRGFNFITWTNDFNITASSLHTQLSTDDYVIMQVYNPTTDTWKPYNPALPPGFPGNDDFYIEPYDVISFNAGIGHDDVTYDTSSIT
jgi:PKD repeat protein